jgi:O-antigen/teichoic acid export membrane protein
VIGASAWSTASYALVQALRLASSLLMTRLLAPDMFGVMALVHVLMYGLNMFSDIGVRQAIVQSRRGEDPVFLDAAWMIQIARGGLIFAITLALACGLALADAAGALPSGTVYADPRLPEVIGVMSLTPLITGFESTKFALAWRSMSLAGISKIEVAGQVAAVLAMALWGLADPSIWALVAGAVASNLVRTTLTHLVLPGAANRLRWDPGAAREVMRFGKWVFLSSILAFLVVSGDRLVLGALVSAELVGLYAIAFVIAEPFRTVLSRLVVNVTFPALSEVARNHASRVKDAYYRLRLPIDCAALGAAGFLLIAGSVIVGLLYDARYAAAGPVVEIIGTILVVARYEVAEQCFLALGRPSVQTGLNAVRAAALYLLIPVMFHQFGFAGAIWAVPAAGLAGLVPLLWLCARHGLLDWRRELLPLPAFAAGMVVGYVLSVVID